MSTTRNPGAIPHRPMQDVGAALVIKMGLAGLILLAFVVVSLVFTLAFANWRAIPLGSEGLYIEAWAFLRWGLVLGVLIGALALVRMAWADVQHEIERFTGTDLDGDGDVGGVEPEPRLIYVKGGIDQNALPEPTAADLATFVRAVVEARDWTMERWLKPGSLALPSGRRLTRPYYEAIMDILETANIITGRERRKAGYLNVDSPEEALELLGVGEEE